MIADHLLSVAANEEERARLLAVSTKESGAWLRALPVSALAAVKVAVGLRLGTPVCGPHTCQYCGTQVDSLGRHALSCVRSEGHHQRHSAMNDVIKCALVSAHVPSQLEPAGLSRSDGKRPDGVTLAPWKSGQLLVWDATCPDTFAPSYRAHATQEAGKVTERAEERKVEKYRCLPASHLFCPVAIETLGAVGPQSLALIKDIARRIASETGESRAGEYLLQRLSVAVQRGNPAAVLGGTGF